MPHPPRQDRGPPPKRNGTLSSKSSSDSLPRWLGGSANGLTFIDMFLACALSVIGSYVVFGFGPQLPQRGVSEDTYTVPYNTANLYTEKVLDGGARELHLLVVTDLDHDTKHPSKKNTWWSLIKKGVLTLPKDASKAKIEWLDQEDFHLSTNIAAGGRAMELSDLVVFNGNLYAVDDRTGIIFEIHEQTAIPYLLLNDGPGNVTKGLKGEWMTVKDEHLYIGGLGKEWTTTEGEYVNDHPMWVKQVSAAGEVRHLPWKSAFEGVRRAVGIEYPGYMIHEAVQWSPVHRKWFFLPRRASNEKYTEAEDEHRGTNVMVIANEAFTKFDVVRVGQVGDGARGFSAFQFIPGTNDELIIALKSEEKDGKPVASYASIFDLKGKVLVADTPLPEPYKFEGIAFI